MRYSRLSESDTEKLKDLVKEAKFLLEERHKLRMEVAQLAIEAFKIKGVCVKYFAQEIGINPSTLAEWVSLKKSVYDKLPKTPKYQKAKSISIYKDLRKILPKDSTGEEVQQAYDDYYSKGKDYMKFAKYIKVLNTIIFNIEDEIKLTQATDEQIVEIEYLCNKISKQIKRKYN